ncbi:MAG: ATP-binding protein [Campylobacterales bacterium]|nr:ATP-binding protein [Campylobacterales bacterium]
MYTRYLHDSIQEAMGYFPAILITGARQSGKSTLSMGLCENYITLDDIMMLSLAKNDPVMFVSRLKTPIVIDEIQKAPELLSAIKMAIDSDRRAGAFILTGSANVLDFKNVGDTLAGRIALFELSPLSNVEVEGMSRLFVEELFNDDFNMDTPHIIDDETLYNRMLSGMYPDMLKSAEARVKYIWLSSYISTYIERDIRDIENIRNTDKFARLIHIIASRSGAILNKADLSNASNLDTKTLDNHLTLLEMVYQIKRVRPYYANIGKRFVKSEKLFFTDTGILNFLLGIQSVDTMLSSSYIGSIFETFVYNELYKQVTYLLDGTQIYYYRTLDKKEIDFIIERHGKVAAIEVKFAKKVTKEDCRHILDLQRCSIDFHIGIVIYMGSHILPLGENIWAVPFGQIV